MNADVVIVGSGISALTLAAILAKNGQRVIVVEQRSTLGGSLRQFKLKRTSFDVGFHYTGCAGDGEILNRLWQYCGVLPQIPVVSAGDDGYDRFEFRDVAKPVRGYFSYEKFIAELKKHFPQEHNAIDVYCNTIRNICLETPFYNTDLPWPSFLRGYRKRPVSLDKFLDKICKNPYLKAVLAAPGFLYGTPTRQASLETHALVAHGYYSGAYTIIGGGQTIVDAFLAVLADYGVEMYAGYCMDSVLVENGDVAGVSIAAKGVIKCNQVIYTGHPTTLIDLVPSQVFRPAYRRRLLKLKNSCSLFAVFGTIERPLESVTGPLNYYLLPGKTEVLPGRNDTPHHLRPMMMTGARATPPDLLQHRTNSVTLLQLGYWQDVEKFAHSSSVRRPESYKTYKGKIATAMIQTAQRHWGDICGSFQSLAVATPLTFRDELSAPEGCVYGAMHRLDQFNPDVRTRLPGLLLAGQSTLMTGVVGASISALVAAGEILGLEFLWEAVK